MMAEPSFRLLDDGITDPFLHFAVEEAILDGVERGTSPPTLRVRRALPSVWIGIYQDAAEDVDLSCCRALRIPIVRRYNPGGAVYQDEGSLCFSLFFLHRDMFRWLGLRDHADLYLEFGRIVADTCREYGVEAAYSSLNDVTIGGRKVYGSAQVERGRAFVHSGTLLVSTDCSVMARVLRPSRLKFADKGFTNVRDRVITLSEAAGRTIPVSEVAEKLVECIARRLRITLSPADLLPEELQRAQDLHQHKYSRPEWTFQPASTASTVLSTKVPSGVLTLAVDLDRNALRAVEIRGDFLAPRQADIQRLAESLKGRTPDAARSIVQRSPLPRDVRDGLASLFTELATHGEATHRGAR